MGVEFRHINNDEINGADAADAPVVLGLQPSALVDHVARVDLSFLSRIHGEAGGSFPVLLVLVANCFVCELWFLFLWIYE